MNDLHFLTSRFTENLLQPKQCGIGIRQTSKSMEKREVRNRPTRIVSMDFLPQYQVNTVRKFFSAKGADPLDIYAEISEYIKNPYQLSIKSNQPNYIGQETE